MTTEDVMMKSVDIPKDAVGFSAFRVLHGGKGRQYTACEMRKGWQGVERFVRICQKIGYLKPWTESNDGYAVLDVIDAGGDIVADFNVPTAAAFRYIKRQLKLAVEPEPASRGVS
jgi:hypothetical protein